MTVVTLVHRECVMWDSCDPHGVHYMIGFVSDPVP